jgi:thymidylate synthase (FAD)
MGATEISQKGLDVVRRMVKGEKVDAESSGMSKREWNELMDSLKIEG